VLSSNSSSGYRWTFDDPPADIIEIVPGGYETSGPGFGTGGNETWTIRARKEGRAVLAAKYWRPWEGESSVIERFAITLDVAAS
jgi:inhibitor of cysteine peptidase